MLTRIQTLAAAIAFDGTAGQGLVDFLDVPLVGLNDDVVPVIVGVSYDNNIAESIGLNCFLKPAADSLTTTRRYVVFRSTSSTGFGRMGCYIPVPRSIVGAAGFVPWQLVLLSTGKTLEGSLIVSYRAGTAGGNVP